MFTQSGRKRWREDFPFAFEIGVGLLRLAAIFYIAYCAFGFVGNHARMIREIHQRLIPQSCTKIEVP